MYINFENYDNNWDRANAVIKEYRKYCNDNTYRAITEKDVIETLKVLMMYFQSEVE
jgi:hypothetical protein